MCLPRCRSRRLKKCGVERRARAGGTMDDLTDRKTMRNAPIDDGVLRFERAPYASTGSGTAAPFA